MTRSDSSSRPIYFSRPRPVEWEIGVPSTIPFGWAHYSHDLVGRRIRLAIESLGRQCYEIKRPEMFKTAQACRFLPGFQDGDVHLIFKPFEQIRVLSRSYNIVCAIWEFDRIPDSDIDNRPFNNYARMLRLADEVWCYSEHARLTLGRYVCNVHRIPVPVDCPGRSLGGGGSLSARLARIPARRLCQLWIAPAAPLTSLLPDRARIYLSILNPHDRRKDLIRLLRGFELFATDKPDAMLILKLIVDPVTDPLSTLRAEVEGILAERSLLRDIVVVKDVLDRTTIDDLYRLADFYLCTSHCEGLCLPLLEGMGAGTVPVSVGHTAMVDYLAPENAFLIASDMEYADAGSNSLRDNTLKWHTASLGAVCGALSESYQAAPTKIAAMRERAITTVRERYSIDTARAAIGDRLARIVSRRESRGAV